MIQKLWRRISGSLQVKTTLLIVGLMTLSLAAFAWYDVNTQRRALEHALEQKGKSLAISGAATIGHILEDAIASGRLTEAEVFDTEYQLFSDTYPEDHTMRKYHTAYDAFTDANFPKVQDAYLEGDVAYAVAVDIKGYVPTHNAPFAKPISGDYAADAQYSRSKRIYTDPVAVQASAHTQRTLKQIYDRNMGTYTQVMWDISAPIWVNGKHWGVFRVGFSLASVNAIAMDVTRRILLAALGVILVIGVVALLIARSVSRPILALRDVAVTLARGDLTQAAQVHSQDEASQDEASQDEVGQLAAALNKAVSNWREIISNLRDNALHLSTTAAELAASSEELSRTTAAQSDQISRTASAAEEMAATIREVAHSAERAAQASTTSSQRAKAGGQLTAETAARLDQANHAMQQLRGRSDEIGKIVQLIQDVAAQTNILALNAAIEAAGAGVAGARFDVVAEEIRKLAGRTSQATGEIAELIRAVQADTQAAAEAISKGAAMAQESGASLADIVASSASVNDMVQSISAATAEQSSASGEIANSIDAMVDSSQQTTIATRETAQIGVELSNLAEHLKEAADQFKVR